MNLARETKITGRASTGMLIRKKKSKKVYPPINNDGKMVAS